MQYTINGVIPRSKKNSQQIVNIKGRPIIMPSQSYKKYEADCAPFFMNKPEKPIDYPVELSCVFMMPLNKDGSVPKKKLDMVNLIEAIQDILVKYGILEDDNCQIIRSLDGSRVVYVSEGYGTIINITKVEDNEESTDS